jgi:hypothetical protein
MDSALWFTRVRVGPVGRAVVAKHNGPELQDVTEQHDSQCAQATYP